MLTMTSCHAPHIAPRRKIKGFRRHKGNWPLPIPIRTPGTNSQPTAHDWPHLVGNLSGNCVTITDFASLQLLTNTFFGENVKKTRKVDRVAASTSGGKNQFQVPLAVEATLKDGHIGAAVWTPHRTFGGHPVSSTADFQQQSDCAQEAVIKTDLTISEEPRERDETSLTFPSSLELAKVLSLQESFYLSYALGCLTVLDRDEKPINLEDMWGRYNKLDCNFLPKYVSYHHFRSKGWVVKSGLKFGSDYLLYEDGPSYNHASYSVLVISLREGETPQHGTTWLHMMALQRITQHVAKELLLCYVSEPLRGEEREPWRVDRFKIKEVLLRRWVAAAERLHDARVLPFHTYTASIIASLRAKGHNVHEATGTIEAPHHTE